MARKRKTAEAYGAPEGEARPTTAASRYTDLEFTRRPFLERARDAARLTIPSLLPPEGHTGPNKLYQPYQSVGADMVNNLSSKLLLAIFPPGSSFFRFTLDDFVAEELAQAAGGGAEGEDARAEFEEALGKMERAILNRMEQKGTRHVHFEAIQHLVTCGNALIHVLEDGSEKFFALDKYVVKRDLSGNVLEILVKESLSKAALPPKAAAVYERHYKANDAATGNEDPNIDLFTWVKRQESGGWKVHQEVCGEIIPGTEGSYPKEKSAWIPLRWTRVSGEDYGRGRVEEYYGDLRSLESACQSIVEFAAAAAKILVLVNPSGTTKAEDVAGSPSGAVIEGDARDITILMLEKFHDFQVLRATAEDTKNRLERAFLMASAVQRNAERVTAEEVRLMVGELEQSLGGVYSLLSEEFQRPLAVRVWHRMQENGQLPRLPEGTVSPQIVTGLDGLGRNSDLQKLDVLLAGMAQHFGPEALREYVNVGAYAKRRGAALGIDLTGLVREEREVQASRQQQMQAQMAEKLGPPVIKAAVDSNAQAQAPAPTQE